MDPSWDSGHGEDFPSSQGHKAVESVASAMNAEILRETAATGQVAVHRSGGRARVDGKIHVGCTVV